MKLPRVICPGCGRDVAAAPVTGHLTKGSLWRHDDVSARRDANGDLVSCSESLSTVELPEIGRQMKLTIDVPDPNTPMPETEDAVLF